MQRRSPSKDSMYKTESQVRFNGRGWGGDGGEGPITGPLIEDSTVLTNKLAP